MEAMSKASPPAASADCIGVRTLQYRDAKRERPVVVELWHPTEQKGPLDQPEDVAWVHPNEVRNAPLTSGKYPLILLSHGHGGDRRDRSWLAEELVKKGYLVASVEHYGNSWKTFNKVITLRFWERARDISFAISELLTDPNVRERIDPRRIGFIGYSLGGMTGLALGGAKAAPIGATTFEVTQLKEEFGADVLEEMDFSESEMSYADPRIKAMVLLTPAAFAYDGESLKEIQVPVALVASKGDEILPFDEHAKKVITHLSNKKVKLLRDQASHYVFLNRVSAIGKRYLKPELHAEALEADRAIVHRELGSFIADFFKENLK